MPVGINHQVRRVPLVRQHASPARERRRCHEGLSIPPEPQAQRASVRQTVATPNHAKRQEPWACTNGWKQLEYN